MQDFKKLSVWKISHEFTLEIYHLTRAFPEEEKFGLISQIRRSSSSIPANIAEGCGRGGKREMSRFLRIAFGSAAESEYHLLLAKDLGFIENNYFYELNMKITAIKKMLSGLIKSVQFSDH